MRLASYNVENLFDRAKIMNQESWADGRDVLKQFSELNALLGEEAYTDPMKQRMAQLLKELGLEKSDESKYVLLRRNRGALLKRPKGGGIEIVADGRADWAGSLELVVEPITEEAMRNTARAMHGVGADVLAVVEAESRPALKTFNDTIIPAVGGVPFRHAMLIDGNDSRGIDVGLLTRDNFPIGKIRSHVDDLLPGGQPVFSRDCPEFEVQLPSGERLLVLVNHFKSKGYGAKNASDERRRAQAARVKAIYESLYASGEKLVAVVGDFNDTPDSKPLEPLICQTNLKDAFKHPSFKDGGYPGTFGYCNSSNKIDFLLLSPDLFDRVSGGSVFRMAMWPGSRPRRWDTLLELEREADAGSDHAAVWVDLNI
jgi:endonuclease/exonuclease/phosphatase family metal-dependent hydrolase